MAIHPYTRFFILPSAPTVDEDETEGYEVGDVVLAGGSFYDLSDATAGAAVWTERGAGSGSTAWGDITGTLADQADLQAALDALAALDHVHGVLSAIDPTVNDDESLGYEPPLLWVNTTSNVPWLLVDSTDGAAIWVSLNTYTQDEVDDLITALAAVYQPLDSDLTSIAGLTPSNDDIVQRKAGSWVSRTMAQLITDLTSGLSALFAPLAKGVTNGDSHDHNGGDGNQINHTLMSNIGSNSHSVIDSHLASTTNPHSVTAAQAGAIPDTGWQAQSAHTWTYVSADDPVYQVYVNADVTSNIHYKLGNKVKCTNNSTTFYGFIVKVGAYDSGNNRTPIDLYGGTDYDLANSAITAPCIAKVKSPDGFPLNPDKWTVTTTDSSDRTQSSPVTNTWYNPGSLSISIPIGVWHVSYKVLQRTARAAATLANMVSTLSTANNSESDADFTTFETIGGASGSLVLLTTQHCLPKILALTAKTSYFLNCRTTSGADSIGHRGDSGTTVIRAVCAYL